MEDNKFWLAIWKLVSITLVALSVSIGGCVYGQGQQVKSLIKSGILPILAMCAIHGTGDGRGAQCTVAQMGSK
jgi:hypothetical protein